MLEINKDQLMVEVEAEEIKTNKIINIMAGNAIDVWNDYGSLPPEYSGTIRWRKPSNQNILEIYLAVNYSGNLAGRQFFGWLPEIFSPSFTKTILGVVTYREGTVNTTRFQLLNVTEDGLLDIYAPSTAILRNMLFYGMIDL